MNVLYLGSTSPHAGKTVLAAGLALTLKEQGYRVGYLKPLGTRPTLTGATAVDRDARFLKELLDLPDDDTALCPVVLTHDLQTQGLRGDAPPLLPRLDSALAVAEKGRDILLVGGAGNLWDGAVLGLAGIALVKRYGWPVLLIDRYVGDICVDCILAVHEALRDRLIGVVLNRVRPESRAYVTDLVAPYLERQGIPVFAVLPHDDLLHAITVASIAEVVAAEVLAGASHVGNLVEHLLIGAMDADHALEYFARTPHKAVITGGDRADMHLAALETKAACLILTGRLRPHAMILAAAEAQGVPVLVVPTDTMATVEAIERVMDTSGVRDATQVRRAQDLLAAHGDWRRLRAAWHLPPAPAQPHG